MWSLLRLLPPSLLTFIKRHTPARLRFAIRQSLGADYRSIPDKVTAAPDGRLFHIGPDPIYWAIYHGLEYEPEATGIVRAILRDGDIVVDIGANTGWYTTLCAQLVGPDGHVYAFEPVPSTRARLDENIALNHLSQRVTVIEKAVGSVPGGTATIHLFDDRSPALASLAPIGTFEFVPVPVAVTTLAEFATDHGVRRIDFLKCDVEGAELEVLKGARPLLIGPDAPLILIELNAETSRAFGHTKQDLMRLLEEVGYRRFFDIAS